MAFTTVPEAGRSPGTAAILAPWMNDKEFPMQALAQMPMVYAAIEYSAIYMLLGGGFVGATVIYFIARAMGR